ncbi:MAG: hypothetical protein KA099_06620 [Alphaproteobacteria bacterium]|nr:hypothetical protein [Alphaproteobacteria bacterium]MBP7758639.1 hypothetical protein [Alphaproteobacteria bacterium]MBP7763384.1 hypothetical protein [Alphaproteobacteria bacterium]MBP7904983.1 hypothetical protein [Alphaproteobacteria bacterium]
MTVGPEINLTAEWQRTQDINQRLMDRNRRWDELYQAGGGKVSDFLRADFGTEDPAGLQIDPTPDQTIAIKSMIEAPGYKDYSLLDKFITFHYISGFVIEDRDDAIYLNPRLFPARERQKSFDPVRYTNAALGHLLGHKTLEVSDTASHEFAHTRQHHIEKGGWRGKPSGNDILQAGLSEKPTIARYWREANRFIKDISALLKQRFPVDGYFAETKEMQARMHEMLAVGYAQWQKLPTTRTELWAALSNMGVEPTEAIRKQLEESEDGKKALADFAVTPAIAARVAHVASTFNNIASHVGEADVKEGLWVSHYPALYGELLEFYGDGPGRARMGLGQNPRAAIEAVRTIRSNETEMSESEATQIAASIPPASAAPFLNKVMMTLRHSPYNARAMQVSQALLTREDVRQEMFRDRLNESGSDGIFYGNQVARNYLDTDNTLPLSSALNLGNTEMVRIIMKAGANPFQRYLDVDIRDKPLFSSSAAQVVLSWAKDMDYLADPTRVPKTERERVSDPGFREWVEARGKAIETMLESSPDPDRTHPFVHTDGTREQVSLRELVDRAKRMSAPDPERPQEYEL